MQKAKNSCRLIIVFALNQYVSIGGQALAYDGRFNLTGHAGATFTYDAQNRLVSASRNGNTV